MWWRLRLQRLFIILSFATVDAKDPELPLCPTNMQYFPQNLPMHCRFPGTLPPFLPPVYQNPSVGKQSPQMPFSIPGMPAPIPGAMPGPMPMPMVPMPSAPAHKLPVIVMPFYSPDTSDTKPHTPHQSRPKKYRTPRRKKRPIYYSSDEDSTDTDSSTDTDDSTDSSSERGLWRGPRAGRRSNRHHKSKRKKHQQEKGVLTPILQYVTKDGYVIYEKQISKGEAKDWLGSNRENQNAVEVSSPKTEGDIDYEPREDKNDKKFLMNHVEQNIEVKTELNPHQVHKKKNYQRKAIKKKGEK